MTSVAWYKGQTTIILTCGHKVNSLDEAHQVIVKFQDRCPTKAISYRTVCTECKHLYEEADYILRSEEEAIEWLGKKEW